MRVLPLGKNEGFGRANNRGAAIFPTARCYLLVNSDAFVHRPGSVGSLVGALERERVALAVPRLLNHDLSLQRTVVALPTPGVAFAQAVGLSRILANRAQPSWGTRWDHAKARPISSATGAVIAVRGCAWRTLGGFSERAHMFAEDHDLFWRARKLGWIAGSRLKPSSSTPAVGRRVTSSASRRVRLRSPRPRRRSFEPTCRHWPQRRRSACGKPATRFAYSGTWPDVTAPGRPNISLTSAASVVATKRRAGR